MEKTLLSNSKKKEENPSTQEKTKQDKEQMKKGEEEVRRCRRGTTHIEKVAPQLSVKSSHVAVLNQFHFHLVIESS